MNTLAKELADYRQHFPHLYGGQTKDNTMAPQKGHTYTRLTTADKDRVNELFALGYNGRNIADKTKLSYSAVIYHLRKVKSAKGHKIAHKTNKETDTTTTRRTSTVRDVSTTEELLRLKIKNEVLMEMLENETTRRRAAEARV
jgi:hypothetical protein